VTYTGLTIDGGHGIDAITNGAASGTIVLGNGGTSLAAATTGTVTNNNETVTFGSGFDAAVIQNGTFSAGFLGGTAFETQTVNGTLASNHDLVNVVGITGNVATIADESTLTGVTSTNILTNAEQAVATAVGNNAVGYFTWTDGNEYIVATSSSATTYGSDAAVELVGGAFHNSTIAAGVITLVT
jgi:hypothetical protein